MKNGVAAPMLFADIDLARRLESVESEMSVEAVKACNVIRPDIEADTLRVAGTTAVYTGPESPLSQVFGLGLYGGVTEAELDDLEAFYKSRSTPTNIELCPLADLKVLKLLVEKGYQPIEFTNVLVRKLHPHDADLVEREGVHVRQAREGDADPWAEVVARGFLHGEPTPEHLTDIFKAFFHLTTSTCFFAESEGEILGGGLVSTANGVAALAATSTLPIHRGKGGQTALIKSRLAFAAAAGCDLAMVSALPGSVSQRNIERHGFRVVYTRCKFFKA